MDTRSRDERRKKGERNELKRHLLRLLLAGEMLVEGRRLAGTIARGWRVAVER